MITKKGFTLLEVLFVIAAISILASIVILAINPSRQLALDRNVRRKADVKSLINAAYQRAIDSSGDLFSELSLNWQMIGTATSGCSISCGISQDAESLGSGFIDSGQSSFDAGNYDRVMYSGINDALALDSIGLSDGVGTYTSALKNINNVNLLSLSWTPNAPYGKPLPNNQQSETSYPAANVNMGGNVLLFHGDETLGASTFTDYSGLNNNGVCGTKCPQVVAGKINSGLSFNVATAWIAVANSASLNPSNNITIEAWVKWEINPTLAPPYASIVSKNFDRQYRLQHNYNNTKFEFAIAMNYIASLTTPQAGKWYHLVGTYNGSIIRLYVNGVEESSRSYSGTITGSAEPLVIGARSDASRSFKGSVDEVAVYNRALTDSEIVDRYDRGAKMLKIKTRTCSDQSCSGAVFVGPDGTINSYYSDDSSQLGLPSRALSGLSGSYFQYQTTFETNTDTSPKLHNLSVDSSVSSQSLTSYASTTEACLDLTPLLVDKYITDIPHDPKVGSIEKTYYAIKKSQNNRISVMACSPELEENILLSY